MLDIHWVFSHLIVLTVGQLKFYFACDIYCIKYTYGYFSSDNCRVRQLNFLIMKFPFFFLVQVTKEQV